MNNCEYGKKEKNPNPILVPYLWKQPSPMFFPVAVLVKRILFIYYTLLIIHSSLVLVAQHSIDFSQYLFSTSNIGIVKSDVVGLCSVRISKRKYCEVGQVTRKSVKQVSCRDWKTLVTSFNKINNILSMRKEPLGFLYRKVI